jgi:hypothetical protein
LGDLRRLHFAKNRNTAVWSSGFPFDQFCHVARTSFAEMNSIVVASPNQRGGAFGNTFCLPLVPL